MAQVFVYNFTHTTATGAAMIATATSTGPMLLSSVIMNTPGAGANAFQIYNGTSTAGTMVCSIAALGTSTQIAPYMLTYNVMCQSGIFFNNTGGTSGDVTVVWA